MTEKRCGKCRAVKPLSEFWANRSHKDGLDNSCRDCKRAMNKAWNDSTPRRQLGIALKRALIRRPTDDPITVDGIMDLWAKQGGRCALSGVEMVFRKGAILGASVSIDRIDQDGGYAPGNVRLVCHALNCFRGRMADGDALSLAVAMVSFHTCASCGVVDARSRKSQAVFACVHCDHTDNADVNAAREILRRGTASMGVEGSHWRPREASIMAAA